MNNGMSIQQAATASGLTPKMLRHYETKGLLSPQRGANGYRYYSETSLPTLQLIARARQLGFSLAQIENLLALYPAPERASRDVHQLALQPLAQIEQQQASLALMASDLQRLIALCPNNQTADCAILQALTA